MSNSLRFGRAGARTVLAWPLAFLLSSAPAVAAEKGDLSLSPADVAVEEMERVVLVADEAPTSEPATQPAEPAASQPTSQPTSQPSDTWPPGLIMKALAAAKIDKPLKDLGIRVYGYVEPGFTGLLHGGPSRHPHKPLPLRLFEAHKFNNLLLNQLKLTIDRPVDTSKPFDLGGRVDNLYGSDARSIHAYGLCDEHSIQANPPFSNPATPWPYNTGAHYDLEQLYAEMWLKTGKAGQGFDLIFGKWATPMGAEVIDAPGNFLYSHSYLFDFAVPFTHTGVKLTYNFDPSNSVYFAAVRGWDTFQDNNRGASWMGGFTVSSKGQVGSNPRSQFVLNTMAGPEQFSDPRISGHRAWHAYPGLRYLIDATWTYHYTEKLTQVINGDFGYEEDVPNTIDHRGVVRTRDADWYGIAYYLNYVFNDYVSTTGRAEWFRDHYGARTGFAGDFYEITTGVGITPCPKDKFLKDLIIRPELRWDFSANNEPFAGPRKHDEMQMTAAVDVIYKF
jgi:hypothetical protein